MLCRRHRGLRSGRGTGRRPGARSPLASDSEDEDLPRRSGEELGRLGRRGPSGATVGPTKTVGAPGPARGDATLPRVVLESDPEEPGVCPDVRRPQTCCQTSDWGHLPDVTAEPMTRAVGSRWTLLVESDTDVEDDTSGPDVGTPEPCRVAPDVPRTPPVEPKSSSPPTVGSQPKPWMLVVDSDTDVEEIEGNPDVGCPKRHGIARRDADVEVKKQNPDVEEPQWCDMGVASDTDVEDDCHPRSHKTPRNTWKDPTVVMETPYPDVGGLRHGSGVSSGDSDTDVEVESSDTDVEGPKSHRQMFVVDRDTDVEDLATLPSAGAPEPHGTGREVVATAGKMAAAPDVGPEGWAQTSDNADVKASAPDPDVGAPEAQRLVLNMDSDTDVEDSGVIPDVGTGRGCRGEPGGPHVAAMAPNPDVPLPTSPQDSSDTDIEEVAPTPDVRSLWYRSRRPNGPLPDVVSPAAGGRTDVEETPPKRRRLSPKRPSDTDREGAAPNPPDFTPRPDASPLDPDVEPPAAPVASPDVPAAPSPHPAPAFGGDGGAVGAGPESDTDTEEDPDLFLEPTQNFLAPVAEGPTLSWDPEAPTQPFYRPEEEEEPPRDPPAAGDPPAELVTVTPAREGTGAAAPPAEEAGGGPRCSQHPPGGGARQQRGGASGERGGASSGPAPLRRSARLQARPQPRPEPPVTKGRAQAEPRPSRRPRPRRTGHASPQSCVQEEEEEPPAAGGAQLRPRGRSGSAPPKVLFTGVVASPAMEVALRTLGGAMATSVFDCTHLVTDSVRRTVKFLCAVARGVPIVTPEWLYKSASSGRVLAPGPFLVRDNSQERHFGFSLAQALQRARRCPLLQGYEIHVTPSVRPEPEHMRDIITCSGGTFLPIMPHTYGPRRLVISCREDAGRWAPALGARLPLASAELLLTGLLRQRLQLQQFLLPTPPGAAPQPHGTAPTPPAPPAATSGRSRGTREVAACGRGQQPPRGPPRTPPRTRRRAAAAPNPPQ